MMTDKVKEHYEQLRARYFASPELKRLRDELQRFDSDTERMRRATWPPPTSHGQRCESPDDHRDEIAAREKLRPELMKRIEKLERQDRSD